MAVLLGFKLQEHFEGQSWCTNFVIEPKGNRSNSGQLEGNRVAGTPQLEAEMQLAYVGELDMNHGTAYAMSLYHYVTHLELDWRHGIDKDSLQPCLFFGGWKPGFVFPTLAFEGDMEELDDFPQEIFVASLLAQGYQWSIVGNLQAVIMYTSILVDGPSTSGSIKHVFQRLDLISSEGILLVILHSNYASIYWESRPSRLVSNV
ncbi:hypothetical protein K435DRAFT_934233 [Dendrothele bispora CBS 962.96]|uniref:Uncharacterized protein n=1 Tax=Dendrothele bispora (strain CBS 962.96) TaxID=1314807 RepID=A0A4S8MCW0_DENBC|nr:hypothetical protein K435DRAFT_934233 [Dendrothele bispora CBS 962.96]